MGAHRLKIVAGPHRGGEMLLPESGELVIGSDDACDLVLSDPALAGRHARLRLDGQARLIPLEGAVSAEGLPLPAEGEAVVDFRVYTLGGTQVRLGPDQGEWPSPAGESRQVPEKKTAPAAETRPERRRPSRFWPGRSRKAALAALGLALALGLAWLLWPAGSPTEAWTDFQARLAEAGYAGLALEPGPKGEPVLTGWLDSEPQVARLEEMLRASWPDAVVKVESVRALAAGLNARARALGYALLFTPERGSRIRVRGYAQNAEAAAGMRRALEPELRTFADDEWEIKTWADLEGALSALASTRRLPALRFEPQGAAVAVSGLQKVPAEAWAAFQEEIQDLLGAPLVFVQASPPAATPSAPPLPPGRPAVETPAPGGALCRGLTRDPADRKGLRYAGDGSGYPEGAVLPGGQRVVSVLPQGVFLEREGVMYYCSW
jgi:type III secretion protein D